MVAARLLATFVVALLTYPALAGREDATWNPPPEFDRPYSGKLVVRYLPQPQVFTECKRLFLETHGTDYGAYPEMRGCSIQYKNSCVVVVVNKTWKRATPQAVLRHEIGHCNGWTHPID